MELKQQKCTSHKFLGGSVVGTITMTFRKTLGNQMTGPTNQIPVLKHQRHVTLERRRKLLAQESKWRWAIFSLPRKKNFLYTRPMICSLKLLRPPHCCTVHHHSSPAPLAPNATVALSRNCPCPTRGEAVPHSRATSPLPASLSPPGSQHGALPVHAGRSSSAFSCPPHTNTHMGPSCGPWPLSLWEAPSRRAEKDRGCNRKEKEAAML